MQDRLLKNEEPVQPLNGSIALVAKTKQNDSRFVFYQNTAFILTAVLYAISHASRTVYGYCKSSIKEEQGYTNSHLGLIDFTFMSAYAISQYVNGWLGDHINIKISLGVGMICAATGLSLFGYLEGIRAIGFLSIDLWISVSILVISLVNKLEELSLKIIKLIGWLIDAIEAHASYGANVNFLFIVSNSHTLCSNAHGHGGHGRAQGISCLNVWKIRHVSQYDFALFCIKGVVYGVLFWLPAYLTDDVQMTGDISLILASIELGQLAGSVISGYLADRIKSKSITIAFEFFFAVIFLIFTYLVKSIQAKSVYFTLLLLAGMGIGGPASLIGGAVSSDLGQRLLETSGVNAISTITGIMEGCDATGAALTQLWVSQFQSIVFPTFAILCMAGGLLMLPIALEEYKRLMRKAKESWVANEGNSEEAAVATQNE